MTLAAGSLEYAQARLSARYGNRPDELEWRRLEHARAFPTLLDIAHSPPFSRWVAGIGVQSLPHEIERVLRGHWRELVAEVGVWMPEGWGPAIRWCASLVDLAVLQHLARGGAPLPWMDDDPVYREFAQRAPAMTSATPDRRMPAPLAAAWGDADRIGSLWVAEWRRRIPRSSRADTELLEAVGRALAAHLEAFHDGALRDGWPLRRTLQARLALLFRRALLDPAAAFIFLALAALDLERLRGEFLRRAILPGLAPAP